MSQMHLNLEDNAPQPVQLDRVRGKIAASVLDFCKARGSFHMAELTDFIKQRTGVAPDSPGRILRDLRQRGALNYEVINRKQSLYRVIS